MWGITADDARAADVRELVVSTRHAVGVSGGTLAQPAVHTRKLRAQAQATVPGVAHDTASWEQICINTERLCLRAPAPQDAEAMHELFADPVVMPPAIARPVIQ